MSNNLQINTENFNDIESEKLNEAFMMYCVRKLVQFMHHMTYLIILIPCLR